MNWPTKALGDIVNFYSGGTPSKSKAELWNGSVPWFSPKDMKRRHLWDSIDHISDRAFTSSALREVPAGTVALVVRGMILAHTVPISVLEVNSAINQDIKALIPKAQVDPQYLAEMLRAQHGHILAQVSTSAHGTRKIDTRVLEALQIPLPPLPEQRRVAAILDHADALRTKRTESLRLLEELSHSTFIDMFGHPRSSRRCETRMLGEVSDFFAGGTLPAGQPFEGQTGGFALLKVSDLNIPGNDEWLHASNIWTDTPGARSATCPKDSIVIPKRGGAIGTNKKRITTRPSILDPNLMAINPHREFLNLSYLYAWFKFLDLASIQSGSTVPQLNKQDLAPLVIALPPLAEQDKFATLTSHSSGTRGDIETALAHTDILFSALQSRAFRGGL